MLDSEPLGDHVSKLEVYKLIRTSAPNVEEEPSDSFVREFGEDDQGYLPWLAAHPNGYVVKMRRSQLSRELILHRASCSSVPVPTRAAIHGAIARGNNLTICFESVASLRRWVQQRSTNGGRFSGRCGRCRP